MLGPSSLVSVSNSLICVTKTSVSAAVFSVITPVFEDMLVLTTILAFHPAPASAKEGKVTVRPAAASKNITFPESAFVNAVSAVKDLVSMWFLESTKLWYCLEVFCFKAVVF